MNSHTRTKNSITNIMYGVIGQLITIVVTFLSRTIFINELGSTYLGINGLFTSILSVLSLAELGIGDVIIFSMYKPIAKNDKKRINQLMEFYGKAYKAIGVTIGIIGLILIPFLKYMINDNNYVTNIKTIYILFLINTVVSYFFSYKRSIFIADQKVYINTLNQITFLLIQNFLQILVLITTQNYILYLIIQFICNISSNWLISVKANKLYPFLKNKESNNLDKEDKKYIFKNIRAMMMHKIGATVLNSTDSIVISTFVGVYFLGIYSNYYMIIGAINMILYQVFNSMTASIGNLNEVEDKGSEKTYFVFKSLFFMTFWFYGFCSISLWVLFNPFIKIWIGSSYILNKKIVLIIIVNFFINGTRQIAITYNNTNGLFFYYRYVPLIEAVINLIVSIIFAKYMGILGVLLGTAISTLFTTFWVERYVLFKYAFNKSVKSHFICYLGYFIITVIVGLITEFVASIFTTYTLISFIEKILVCLIIPNLIFVLIFFKFKEFNYIRSIIKKIILQKFKKSGFNKK